MKRLIEWLENYRKIHEWNQREMAERAGVSQSEYCRLISGDREPGVKMLRRLREAFPNAPTHLFLP